MHALTSDNRLVSFRLADPASIVADRAISGLALGEDVLAIDLRPSNGEIFGLSTGQRLVVLDQGTGMIIRSVGLSTTLEGSSFGVDFDPTTDRLQIVSDVGQNLTVDPVSGSAVVGEPLRYVAGDAATSPVVTAAAFEYEPLFGTTDLHGIDSARGVLVRHYFPYSDGTVATIGPLGQGGTWSGLEVDQGPEQAYAVVREADQTMLMSVDLLTGSSSKIADLRSTVEDLTIERARFAAVARHAFEGTALSFTVRRAGELDATVSVDYATRDRLAAASSDYAGTSGSLTFGPGEREKTVQVATWLDGHTEGPEQFEVVLSNPTPGAVLSPATATMTVLDAEPGDSYGLTHGGQIVTFSVNDAPQANSQVDITGLQPDEHLLAIDVRPATGQVVALGSSRRIYTLDPTTGQATTLVILSEALTEFTEFGFDVDPTTDDARVLGHSGQHLRIDLGTGATFVGEPLRYGDGDLNNGQKPEPYAAAYSSNTADAASSELYVVDKSGMLSRKAAADDPTLSSIGGHAAVFNQVGGTLRGLDISSQGGAAFAQMYFGGADDWYPSLYRIDVSTGRGHRLARLPYDVRDIALASVAPAVAPTPRISTEPSASPAASTSPPASGSPTASPSPSPSGSPSASGSPPASPSMPSEPSPTASPAEPVVEPAPVRVQGVTRFAGTDRYSTAAAISRGSFPGTANDVFIVTGANWPDALSAGPAAAAVNGPVLAVQTDSIPVSIWQEIDRLQPSRAWLIGGASVVGDRVRDVLRGRGIDVVRVSGSDRYATAAAVARRFFPDATGAYYASGLGYADALGGGAAAAQRGWPLLLTARDSLPAATPVVGDSRIVLGGPAVISEEVRQRLNARRVSGSDRFTTAAAIALDAFASASVGYLATGLNFPDALAGAPAAARDSAPLLLARTDCVTSATKNAFDRLGMSSVVALGGTAVVSDRAARLTIC